MMTKDEFKKELWHYGQEQRSISGTREQRARIGNRAGVARKNLLDAYDAMAARIEELGIRENELTAERDYAEGESKMSDKIEFDTKVMPVTAAVYLNPDHFSIIFHEPGVEPFVRYHVTLEPIEPELKPCPFCGSTQPKVSNDADLHDHVPSWYVLCSHCGCKGPEHLTLDDAIEAWNRRAP